MTRDRAIQQAIRRSLRTGEAVYVVRESGEWDSATAYDLDTFYGGNHEVEGPYWPATATREGMR